MGRTSSAASATSAARRAIGTYEALRAHLDRADAERGTGKNRLFYLAVPPSEFGPIVEGLRASRLVTPAAEERGGGAWTRVVFEKPFGHDLASARALNDSVAAAFDESQVFRIDHYLGKETVQNLLVFRFANSLFEPVWAGSMSITCRLPSPKSWASRGGQVLRPDRVTRDIVQNHAMQILALVAMEPPWSWGSDAVRDEKVKVLRTLHPIRGESVAERRASAIRYGHGARG